MTIEQLTAEALGLPTQARAQLAERLAVSLDDAELTPVDRLWAVEAHRRADEILSGKVQTIPGAEVFAEIRRSLGQ